MQIQPKSHELPPVPRGVTSFGGAVLEDWLYVYGGHYGKAHHYSRDEQSGDFYRLNLRDPQAWLPLPSGPKLTGVALVAHQGSLYRIGGFTAKNAENEDQDLWSQPGCARFDPRTGQWQKLPDLPEPRSSHDAAVLENTLYVAGGWDLKGTEPSQWHQTAWSLNLADEAPAWRPIASPPFLRRAVALAAHEGRVYCLGGMQSQGGPTTAVAVYDPAADTWREGPELMGTGMDGFGSSAFGSGGSLFVTTMSGSIQRLPEKKNEWEFAGQLEHPRFFHRLLPWEDRLIVVGGASMERGKILPLEMLPVR